MQGSVQHPELPQGSHFVHRFWGQDTQLPTSRPWPWAKAEQHYRALPQRPAKHTRARAETPTEATDVKTRALF